MRQIWCIVSGNDGSRAPRRRRPTREKSDVRRRERVPSRPCSSASPASGCRRPPSTTSPARPSCSRATLYRYFDGKHALVRRIVDAELERITGAAVAAARRRVDARRRGRRARHHRRARVSSSTRRCSSSSRTSRIRSSASSRSVPATASSCASATRSRPRSRAGCRDDDAPTRRRLARPDPPFLRPDARTVRRSHRPRRGARLPDEARDPRPANAT